MAAANGCKDCRSIAPTTLNEAAINGESVPATKTVGADVFGGTVNVSSAITVKVTQT
ncbi:P-type ATPase, partial [Listeria monocytogenes]|uniref:P-type ATPase n=1 Tax=Listeria monocytogenes TaxID=1639 RepID=UPI001EDE1D5A